jgi:hypothetical protein
LAQRLPLKYIAIKKSRHGGIPTMKPLTGHFFCLLALPTLMLLNFLPSTIQAQVEGKADLQESRIVQKGPIKTPASLVAVTNGHRHKKDYSSSVLEEILP